MSFAYQPLLADSAALQAGGSSYPLEADAGFMTVTGSSAGIETARRLTAENGVAIFSGYGSAFSRSLFLLVDSGEIALGGQVVDFLEGLTIGVQAGSLSVNGYSAVPTVARKIMADSAAFVLEGIDADVDGPTRIISLAHGGLDLNGEQAVLRVSRSIAATEAIFGISGAEIGILADAGTVPPPPALNFSLSISL